LAGLVDLGRAIVPFVTHAYADEANPQIREYLVRAAWKAAPTEALPVMAEAIDDPEPSVWKEAIDGLVAIGNADAAKVLRTARACDPERAADELCSFSDWVHDALAQMGAHPSDASASVVTTALTETGSIAPDWVPTLEHRTSISGAIVTAFIMGVGVGISVWVAFQPHWLARLGASSSPHCSCS
jgi:hypothetical protein